MAIRKDPIDQAVKQASGALNLFVLAHGELEAADAKLDDAVETHTAEIERLQSRVDFATANKAQNAKVKAKLTEFIA